MNSQVNYSTLSDDALIRLSALCYDELTLESQLLLRRELQQRNITPEVIERWKRNHYDGAEANCKCSSCGAELLLTTDELVRGLFRCPACAANQEVVQAKTRIRYPASMPMNSLVGIRGWLLLVAAGLVWGTILEIVVLGQSLSVASGLAKAGHGWSVFVWLLVLVGQLSLQIYAMTRFFRKKRDAPKVCVLLLVVSAAGSAFLLALRLEAGWATLTWDDGQRVVVNLIQATIWIPYFRVSKRVKATFGSVGSDRVVEASKNGVKSTVLSSAFACEYCGEDVIPEAIVCPHCRRNIKPIVPEMPKDVVTGGTMDSLPCTDTHPENMSLARTAAHCDECDLDLKADFAFCPQCGATLTIKSCGKCGKSFEKSFNYCPFCGAGV